MSIGPGLGAGGGPNDEVAGLYIGVTGEDAGASDTFRRVYDQFSTAADGIVSGNERMASAAQSAAETMSQATRRSADDARQAAAEEQRLAQARVDAAASTSSSLQNQIELRQRLAQATAAETEQRERYIDAVRREIEVTREQARAGDISPQQRISQTREAYQVPTGYGTYSREQLREGALVGDQDMVQRYRALIAVDKEVEAASNELTRAMVEDAQAQSNAIRDAVRAGQLSREEAAGQYESQLRDFEQYADARAVIERRMLENTQQMSREQQRAGGEHGRAASEALLNAGYMLPGDLGMAAVNLGYLGMGGPTALAVGGAAMVGIGVAGAGYDMAKKAAENEDAMKRLSIAVRDQGSDWQSLSKSVEAWLDVQTRSTIFGRDQTLPALQQLVDGGMKLQDAMTVVRVAEDAAAGSGKSLTDVSQALMRAYEGQPRALTALGLATRDQIRDGMSFADVLKIIEQRYRDQATTTDDFTDKQRQLKNAIDDLERSIGEGLTGGFKDLTSAATDFVRSIDGKKIGEDIRDAVSELKEMHTELSQIASIADKINAAFKFMTLQDAAAALGRGLGSGTASGNRYGGSVEGPYTFEGSGPVERATTASSGTAPAVNQYGDVIDRYARQFGVDPRLAAAVISQESSGKAGAVSSAGALGLGGLMPGTAADLGVTNPVDPEQNIRGSIQYLSEQLKRFSGNVELALTAYNAGPGATARLGLDARLLPNADPNYVSNVLGRLGPSSLNPVGNLNIRGAAEVGGRPQDPFAQELQADQERMQRDRIMGVSTWRQDYEEALQSLISKERDLADTAKAGSADQLRAIKDLAEAERQYADAQKEDQSDQTREQRQREQAEERAFQLQVRNIEDLAARRKITEPEEISRLRSLEQTRGSQSGPRVQIDVANVEKSITDITKGFIASLGTAMDQIVKRYEADFTPDTADPSIARIRRLMRTPGITPDLTLRGQTDIERIETTDVEKPITDAATAATQGYASGRMTRQQYEAAFKSVLQEVSSSRNFSITAISDFLAAQTTDALEKLRSAFGEDASDAMRALSDSAKQMDSAIDETNAPQSIKDLGHLEVMKEQQAALEQLLAKYKNLGDEGVTAVQSITAALRDLSDQESAEAAKAVEETRRELQQRAEEYRQFTDTASERLLQMFEAGRKGAGGFRDTWKAMVKGIEDDFLRSSIASVFFPGGNGSPFNPGADIQKALYGATAPEGFFGGGASSQQLANQAFAKIARAPQGDLNTPLWIQLTPQSIQQLTGSPTGVAPGSATATNAITGVGPGGGTSGGLWSSGSSTDFDPNTMATMFGPSSGGGSSGMGVIGIAGTIAALAVGLFSGSKPPPVNPQQYANLYGSYGSGGNTVFQSSAIAHAFGSGVTGFEGAENLIAQGPQEFEQATGLSANQYALYKQMFSGSGPSSNYSLQQYTQALNTILGGLSTMNAGTPVNTYTLSRTYPNADGSTMSQTGSYWQGVHTETGGPGYGGITPYSNAAPSQAVAQYGVAGMIAGTQGAPGLVSSLLGAGSIIALMFGSSAAQSLSQSVANGGGGGGGSYGGFGGLDGSGTGNSSGNIFSALSGLFSGGGSGGSGGGGLFGALGSLLNNGGNSSAGNFFNSFSSGGLSKAIGSLFNQGGSAPGPVQFDPNNLLNISGPSGASVGTQNLLGALQGFGSGMTLNAILGGNSTWGTVGSAIGSGVGMIGGPLGSLIGGTLGGAIGGLFGPHWGPASNYPDRSNTQQYGSIIADLFGTAGANGQNFSEDPTLRALFGGLNGTREVGSLLAGGATGFEQDTGLSQAQYELALKMFGSGATKLKYPTSNVGILEGTGAGASGQYSYLQYGQMLESIAQGLQETGAVGPYNSYTLSQTYPGSGSSTTTGSGTSTASSTNSGTTVNLDLRGATFLTSQTETASKLADLVTEALARKKSGSLPNPLGSPILRRGTV